MTLQIAKLRRLEALKNRCRDRVLVEPAEHYSQINLPVEGTAADYLIGALGHGTDVAQLSAETGWSEATVISNVYKVAKKTGVGVRRENNRLYLVLPHGAGRIYPRSKVVSEPDTVEIESAEIVMMPAVGAR
jgi:hypothetical protein